MILFCSSMLTGNHDATQLPVVVLGRGGGQIKTGRCLDYSGKSDRQMCRPLSFVGSLMLDKIGRSAQSAFGDATERLSEV